MQNFTKMQSNEKKRGGATRSGINQTSKHIKFDNAILERCQWVKNFNRFVNQAVAEKLSKIEVRIEEVETII